MNQMTLEKIGKYPLSGILGEGAMGIVYRAHDPDTRQTVAIKTIKLVGHTADMQSHEILERFKREGTAGVTLAHPNVVKVHAYGTQENIAYIVMDFVAGESLKALNARKGAWPLFDALGLADQLLMAVDYFHQRGIVHRDIKPSNIMVDQGKHLTVTDFGIARTENSTLTQIGTVLGSPWYMSPEQITEMPIDGRSDLFSVGIILYEMLTGTNPFKADQLMTIIDRIVKEPHARPSAIVPGLPPAVDQLFEKALAKKPQNRFQNGVEFRSALQDMLSQVLPGRDNTAGWHAHSPRSNPVAATPAAKPASSLSAESLAAIAAMEMSLQDHATRDKPRSRTLLWIVTGLAVGGILIMSLVKPTPKKDLTSAQTTAAQPPQVQQAQQASPEPTTNSPASTTEASDDDRLVAEITRQCESDRIERVLIPNINGIVRCRKDIVCSWNAEAVIAMHHKLGGMLSTQGGSSSSPETSAYLDEIGCVANLSGSGSR